MQAGRILRANVLTRVLAFRSAPDIIIPTTHKLTVRNVKSQRKLYEKTVAANLYKRRLAQGPEPERPRSAWINWNYDSEVYSFGKRLGEDFKEDTLRQVFTHRSYVEAEKARREEKLGEDASFEMQDNEEFIREGERIAKEFLQASLRHFFPALPEECVRSVCDHLTSQDTLSYVGFNLGLKDLVLTQEFPVSEETISSTLKAIIGGLVHDQGVDRGYKFVQDFLLTQLVGKDINDFLGITSPASLLQQIISAQGREPSESRLLNQTGSQTVVAAYHVGIYSDKQLLGSSFGETVSIAEEMATRDALRRIFGTTLDRPTINYKQPIPLTQRDFEENPTFLQSQTLHRIQSS